MFWKSLLINFIINNNKYKYHTILDAKKNNFVVEHKRIRSNSDEFELKPYDYQKPGYDNRNSSTDDLEILYNVHNHYQKYELLKQLQNRNLTNQMKLDFVEKNNIFSKTYTYKFNPLKGGLFDDWNNNF